MLSVKKRLWVIRTVKYNLPFPPFQLKGRIVKWGFSVFKHSLILMNFEFNGPNFLFFLLKNFICKHTYFSWLWPTGSFLHCISCLQLLEYCNFIVIQISVQVHLMTDRDPGELARCQVLLLHKAQSCLRSQHHLSLWKKGKINALNTLFAQTRVWEAALLCLSVDSIWQQIWQKSIQWSHNSSIKHFNSRVSRQYRIVCSSGI